MLITHEHSIIVIKDTFNQYPNRYLVYEDKSWDCELFLNYKKNINNESFIKSRISSDLKIDVSDISLDFVGQEIHEKYSVKDKVNKVYCHRFYRANISKFPDMAKCDQFECDGKVYHWRTMAEMEDDKNTMEKNKDIIGYVKALFP